MFQYNQSIKSWAEDDRPREKLVLKGKQNLSDSELIAILLSTGTKNKSAVDLAKELLQLSNNSLLDFSKQGIADLCQVKGIGKAKAISLIAALELGKRRKESEILTKTKLNSSKVAYELLAPFLEDLIHEEFYVIYLNRSNFVIQIKQLSIGGISGTIVDNRLIFKEAINCLASGIILAHNHPSGTKNPSDADLNLTKRIKEISALLDIHLCDHLIITQHDYFSFADAGLI